jgi:hypothetical protein
MNKYWFRKRCGIKSKDVGWGWAPISWEGWLTLFALFGLIGIIGFGMSVFSDEVTITDVLLFLIVSGILVFYAAIVSKRKTRLEN